MNPIKRLLIRLGINRSIVATHVVRALLLRYGHPRLRKLHLDALSSRSLRARAIVWGVQWLQQRYVVVRGPGHGIRLRLDMGQLPLSHSQLGAIALGTLEVPVQEAMVRHLPVGGVFYDIGANVGFFSLLASRFAGASARVYAFEPAPDSAAAIVLNASMNEFENITVIAKAVGARAGTARLQLVDDQAWSVLEDYGRHPGTTSVLEVETVAIDELVRSGELRPPSLVKIDVEGAELAVLEGMRETIAAHHPAIICELHGTHHAFLAAVRELGYRASNLDAATPLDTAGPSVHALALPVDEPGD
jgi:FkbM family methyltransferase